MELHTLKPTVNLDLSNYISFYKAGGWVLGEQLACQIKAIALSFYTVFIVHSSYQTLPCWSQLFQVLFQSDQGKEKIIQGEIGGMIRIMLLTDCNTMVLA